MAHLVRATANSDPAFYGTSFLSKMVTRLTAPRYPQSIPTMRYACQESYQLHTATAPRQNIKRYRKNKNGCLNQLLPVDRNVVQDEAVPDEPQQEEAKESSQYRPLAPGQTGSANDTGRDGRQLFARAHGRNGRSEAGCLHDSCDPTQETDKHVYSKLDTGDINTGQAGSPLVPANVEHLPKNMRSPQKKITSDYHRAS